MLETLQGERSFKSRSTRRLLFCKTATMIPLHRALPLAGITILLANGLSHAGESFTLPPKDGSVVSIVIPATASEGLREGAAKLSGTLEAIFSAPFPLATEAVSPSITLTLAPGPPPGGLERETYSLRTHSNGIVLTGATELALRHAGWDLLHRLGYRQFFPGKTWEVLPPRKSVTLELDVSESPDYASRRIWYGFGVRDHNRDAYADWVEKNRMESGFVLNTGHAYGNIIRSQQKVFDAHPEYYALVEGNREKNPESKMCLSNPGVREATVAYALEFFSRNPDADSVSVDPSDGGHWCECQDCKAVGEPSDLAVLLANTVAEAVREKLGPNRHVGLYAYNYHSPPPAIEVHPQVVVSVATGFIKGGLPIETIIEGWAEKGATLGIREYYSVNTWDRDLPGAARGGRPGYLAETIPAFHRKGARFLSAESSDNWGPNGFGYYLASRLMWDIGEAEKRDALFEDFLVRAFGPAAEPMRQFYSRLDGDSPGARLVFEDQLARLFRSLGEARQLASGDASILARLDDLVLYTRYAELYDRYRNSAGQERQTAFEEVIRYAYRIRGTFMVHSLALFRDLPNRDKSVNLPETAQWNVPEPENPWKSSDPFSAAEIEAMLHAGIGKNTPVDLDFEPVLFDDTTLTAPKPSSSEQEFPAGSAEHGRGERSWFTVVEQAPARLELRVTGGLITHYRDRGNVKIRLFKLGGASATGEGETLVDEDSSVPPDGVERTVTLTATEAGVYRIDLDDGRDLTRVTWPDGQAMSWKMSLDDYPNLMSGRWTLYAWVPPGTRKIGLYAAASAGELRRPDGEKALDLASEGGSFLSLEVPEGSDGQFWKLHSVAGRVSLLTIPPYLARSPSELVLPER